MAEQKLKAVHQSLYPTHPSLEDCISVLTSQLPITQPNQLKASLMSFQNTLLRQQALDTSPGQTVDACAKARYPGQTFDTALPADWVARMDKRGFDVRGHFVMLYPDTPRTPYIAPITDAGVHMAAIVATYEA